MTRMTKQILAAAMGLVVIFPVAMWGAQRSDRPNQCSAINVRTPDSEQNDRAANRHRASRRAPEFSASQILDLEFEVLLSPSLSGNHQLELKVMTPKGHLYQSLAVPFASQNDTNEDNSRRSSHVHRSRRDHFQSATATLPVAGTTIVTSSLYGKWKVEAYLDGAPTVCTAAQSFVIQP